MVKPKYVWQVYNFFKFQLFVYNWFSSTSIYDLVLLDVCHFHLLLFLLRQTLVQMFQYFVSFCFFSIFFYFTLRMGILIESIPLVFFLLIGILLVSFQVLVLFCFTKKFLLFTFSYWRLICLIFLINILNFPLKYPGTIIY